MSTETIKQFANLYCEEVTVALENRSGFEHMSDDVYRKEMEHAGIYRGRGYLAAHAPVAMCIIELGQNAIGSTMGLVICEYEDGARLSAHHSWSPGREGSPANYIGSALSDIGIENRFRAELKDMPDAELVVMALSGNRSDKEQEQLTYEIGYRKRLRSSMQDSLEWAYNV